MSSVTMRVGRETHEALRVLSEQSGRPMQELLEEAVRELQRKRFFEQFNEGYARLKNDPKAWAEETRERAAWESTLGDGLEAE